MNTNRKQTVVKKSKLGGELIWVVYHELYAQGKLIIECIFILHKIMLSYWCNSFQHVQFRPLAWQAETHFPTALSQLHHQEMVMSLSKADYMEMEHGHPAITMMLMTTYKLTCFMSLLSVLLLLKETQMLITG